MTRTRGVLVALVGLASCRAPGPSAPPDITPPDRGRASAEGPSFEDLASEVWDLSGQLRHARALAVAQERLRAAATPEHEVRFQLIVGILKVGQGDLDAGEEQIAAAQGEIERLGIGGLPRAEAMSAQGSLAFAKEDYEAALGSWAAAAQMVSADSAFERRFAGRMGYNQSMALYRLRRFEEARKQAVHALERESSAGVPECPDLALTWRQLGEVHMAMEHYDDATRYLETSVELCAGMPGGELISAGLELSLAHTYALDGRHDEALALIRKARSAVEDDPDGADARFSAAFNEVLVLDRGGRDGDALALVEEVTPRFRKAFGDAHPFMVSLCMERVSLLAELDRVSEAREAVGICRAEVARLPAGRRASLAELLDALEAGLPAAG